MESKYTIERLPDEPGFVISAPHRNTTFVRLEDFMEWRVWNENTRYLSSHVPLFKFRVLMAHIVSDLTRNTMKYKVFEMPDAVLFDWEASKVSRALNHRVRDLWRAIMEENLAPEVLLLQRKAFAATQRQLDAQYCQLVLDTPYLYQDAITYPACMLACVYTSYFSHLPARGLADEFTIHEVLFEDWKRIFAPDSRPYHALNATLMNWPGGIPFQLAGDQLIHVRLPRPRTQRLELLLALNVARHSTFTTIHHDLLLNASARDIRDAMRYVNAHDRQGGIALNTRKAESADHFVSFVLDYPVRYRGASVLGLAKRAVAWHRELVRQQARALLPSWCDDDTPVAQPPIPLPTCVELDASITFLDTVGKIIDEGQIMGHCVGAYASYAHEGAGYYFHVEYRGEAATVEVTPDGQVRQAYGPYNETNEASEWGTRWLGSWGRELWRKKAREFLDQRRAVEGDYACVGDIPF